MIDFLFGFAWITLTIILLNILGWLPITKEARKKYPFHWSLLLFPHNYYQRWLPRLAAQQAEFEAHRKSRELETEDDWTNPYGQ